MNGTELFKADGKQTGVFYCTECRTTHRDKIAADACCAVRLCACGEKVKRYEQTCAKCWDRQLRNKESDRFAKAAHLTEWDGPVWKDGCGDNDGFFATVDAYMEWVDDLEPGESAPAYVWTCDKVPVLDMDLDHILENATAEAYEDFSYQDLSGIEELKAAIDKFVEANKDRVSFVPNYTRALVFGQREGGAA